MMEDVIGPLHRTLRDREVGEIAFEKIDAGEVREVFTMAGDQAVDHADLFAAANQLFCKVRSDEAGATRYEVERHVIESEKSKVKSEKCRSRP